MGSSARRTPSRPSGSVPTAGSIAAWALATLTLATVPILFVLSGTDSAQDTERIVFSLLPVLFAWALLTVALSLSRAPRANVLVSARAAAVLGLLAIAIFTTARQLASGVTFSGDGNWATFWTAATALWLFASRTIARR